MPDVVIVGESEVRDWFRLQLSRRDSRGRNIRLHELGDELGVDKSTIGRNGKKLRNNRPLAANFYKLAEARLVAERLDVLRVRHLQLLRKSQEDAHREEVQRAENARIVRAERARDGKRRLSETNRALRTVERLEVQRSQRRAAARTALEPWLEMLRAAGILDTDDDALYGDAGELIEAGATDIRYVDDGVAAVALAPDDYVFECGLTAAELRFGLTAKQRLQPAAVPVGEDTPEMTNDVPAFAVRRVPMPDELWRYGEAAAGMMSEWRRLTEACAVLATGELPRFVSRDEYRDFERLVHIEHESGYTFKGSVLGEGAERRLRQMKRHAVLPSVMTGVTELASGGLQWLLRQGWKYAAYAVFAVVLMFSVVPLAWGAWELLKFIDFLASSLWELLVDYRWEIFVALAGVVVTAGAVWWIWPKTNRNVYPPRSDSALKVFARAGIVVSIIVFLFLSAVLFVQLMQFIEAVDPYITSISQSVYFPDMDDLGE